MRSSYQELYVGTWTTSGNRKPLDCGTNFVGAEKLLCADWKKMDQVEIANKFQRNEKEKSIRWRFNPPATPHMGGAWERMVKAIKKALYAVTPTKNFTDALLRACLAEAAYLVNSQPLTYYPLDSDESEALTPNHFLLGSSNGVRDPPITLKDDQTLRSNYLTAIQFRNKWWKRWVAEYLPDLVRRTKNFVPMEPLKVGDVVIICDNTLEANSWPKARVIEVFPGKDGQVRSAMVQTSDKIYHRPTSKLAKLDILPEQPSDSTSKDGELGSRGGEC